MQITETKRVVLRELALGDIPHLNKILADPEVMKFSRKGPLDEAGTKGFIEWCIDSYRNNGFGQWAVIGKASGRLIGYCGLSYATADEQDEVEIAYRLAKSQWGKGLASEVASKVLAHGFEILNIETIVGIVSLRHQASIRVLEKIGFRDFSEGYVCVKCWS